MYDKKELIKGIIVLETVISTWEVVLETLGSTIAYEKGKSIKNTIEKLNPLLKFVEEKVKELD